jgi:PTS system nitrogen regulatory IIA component
MRLTELLTPERVGLVPGPSTDFDKAAAMSRLATLLTEGSGLDRSQVEKVLLERESLQSTGIGEGVAIPHGALPLLETQVAALLVVPAGVEFQAIDDTKVTILFAVVSPKRATGEHLKTLARISRLLRHRGFREQLIASPDSHTAYKLIAEEEAERIA